MDFCQPMDILGEDSRQSAYDQPQLFHANSHWSNHNLPSNFASLCLSDKSRTMQRNVTHKNVKTTFLHMQ